MLLQRALAELEGSAEQSGRYRDVGNSAGDYRLPETGDLLVAPPRTTAAATVC